MGKRIIGLVAIALLGFGCSSDSDNDVAEEVGQNIIGTWDVTALRINNETASDDAKFGKQILDYLTDRACTVISLRFDADGSAEATNSANYLEVNAGLTGLEIPCPTQVDTETTTYTYDGAAVTFVDVDGEETTVAISIDGDELLVNANDLDIPNFDEEGELVFTKR